MSHYEIVKDAPVPPDGRGSNARKYRFAEMEVGDSFTAPRDMGRDGAKGCRRQRSIACCARSWVLRNNPTARFITRCLDKDTVQCTRIA